MAAHRLTPPLDASSPTEGSVRKRICKACDRCRLKKSKCDGNSPCVRCQSDNAICVFGERKKSRDKVYPIGFVEQLENNLSLMVAGLQEMYKSMVAAGAWEGPLLKESLHEAPLTHDMLESLGILKKDLDGNIEYFEDDSEMIKVNLFGRGAEVMQHQGSDNSGSSSDHNTSMFNSPVFANANPVPAYSQFSDYAMTQTPPTPPTLGSPFVSVSQRSTRHEYLHSQQYEGSMGIPSGIDPIVLQQQLYKESGLGSPAFAMINSPFRSTSMPDQLFMGVLYDDNLLLISSHN